MSTVAKYPELFDELKSQVKEAGLLERVPLRGTFEMIAIITSVVLALATAPLWHPVLLALFLTLLFTRSVFVSHDILHRQYFKSKSLSMKLSYPFQPSYSLTLRHGGTTNTMSTTTLTVTL